MAHALTSLPYAYDSLEPYIDARTMMIHHGKHHGGYVRKLDRLLRGRKGSARQDLEAIIADQDSLPEGLREDVRSAAGGHLNHSLFWQVMSPGGGGRPGGELLEVIQASFGDFDRFRDEFATAALARIGSGWVWLALGPGRQRLQVISTPNEDPPVTAGCRGILGLDVWEHAYYRQYENRRTDYVAAWWNVVDWLKVAELYGRSSEASARASLSAAPPQRLRPRLGAR